MSEPPPAYKEVPGEDLIAELAHMKAMMEQMRLEKDRLETEAKRKAEEDAAAAQIRAEKEEARELEEIHKRLQESPEYKAIITNLEENNKLLVDSIIQRGEVILFLNGEQGGGIVGMRYGLRMNGSGLYYLTGAITNKHIYHIQTNYETLEVSAGTIYTFDRSLGKKEITLLENLTKVSKNYKNQYSGIGICIGFYMTDQSGSYFGKQKKFESVIRLIPGSYKNGDWRQLDGFFGMYFNETTMEVSEVPPSL
jgi:hypothetical protein